MVAIFSGFGRWRLAGGFCGVGFAVDGFELLDAHLGVNGSGFELFVAEELLDEADVGSAFEHVGGAGVADEVAASRAVDLGFFDELGDHAAEDVGVEWLAVAGEEEGGLVDVQGEAGAGFFEVAFEPFEGAVADGDDAVFVVFSLADLEGLAVAVEVVECEAGEFAAAEARAVEEF